MYIHFDILRVQAVAQRCFVRKVFLEISQNSHENNCARISFLIKLHVTKSSKACDIIEKETLAQVFFCEFYEISKSTFLLNSSGGCFWKGTIIQIVPDTKD